MVGDGRAGSVGERSRELAAGTERSSCPQRAEEPPAGSQRVRSSEEAGNDRGAKGPRKVETEMEQNSESRPAAVGAAAAGTSRSFPKQAGETRPRWGWVERSVWTDRMLNRLEQSEEGTVWFRRCPTHGLPRKGYSVWWKPKRQRVQSRETGTY